ncbi:MAG TPA: class I SAM-dependent methyltransferase [Rhizomicrobium sp.]|nr:class I SAM-dependent methyltransferase [Rhizomicrobium sp.]
MASTTKAFDGLAANYESFRPNYPVALLDQLKVNATPIPHGYIVDVGTGTGILLDQLHSTFGQNFQYVGVEPNHDMIVRARKTIHIGTTILVEASAESMPLPDASAAVITAAQCLHWLDRKKFLAEAARLLAKGGTLAVLYNERDSSNSFMSGYEHFVAEFNAYNDSATGTERAGLGIALLRDGTFRRELAETPRVDGLKEFRHAWRRDMRPDEFVGMCLSTVQMQNVIRSLGEREALGRLRSLIERSCTGGDTFSVPYVTTLLAARMR